MRPLRPDTDLRLGKPLPYQLANQPRPPPKADYSFDLSILCGISLGFPRLSPTQGQVVTCYSPGRHYTHGLLHFPVRLACVRHAASVDSEPGSNSHLKPEPVWVDRQPPPAEAMVHLVSTFRLYGPNISNRHLTETEVSARRLLCADTNVRITSHDWHVQPFVKDQLAFRLSGAPSVRVASRLSENDTSSKLVKAIAFREALSTR